MGANQDLRQLQRPLPHNTQECLGNRIGTFDTPINLGLLVDKYQPWDHAPGSPPTDWKLRWPLREHRVFDWSEKGAKTGWLSELASLTPAKWDEALRQACCARWEKLVARHPHQVGTATCAERMVVGLGGESTLETSLTLHSRFGFPYIPGSAIKGLCRTAALYYLAVAWGVPVLGNEEVRLNPTTPLDCLDHFIEAPNKPQLALQEAYQEFYDITRQKNPTALVLSKSYTEVLEDPLFVTIRAVFGCQDKVGDIVFYDALPIVPPKMAVEIMNPHFPAYYEKQSTPTGQPVPPQDDQEPHPITYLVVEKGSRFRFGISTRQATGGTGLNEAWEWLKFGLAYLGIGGKTTSGFGIFGTPGAGIEREDDQDAPQRKPHYLDFVSPAHEGEEEAGQ